MLKEPKFICCPCCSTYYPAVLGIDLQLSYKGVNRSDYELETLGRTLCPLCANNVIMDYHCLPGGETNHEEDNQTPKPEDRQGQTAEQIDPGERL